MLPSTCGMVMLVLQLWLILVAFLGCSLSQAPGDGSSYCLNETDGFPNPFLTARPSYPADVRPLMDSRDYMSLLLGKNAVWQHVDGDSNNTHGRATHWFQLSFNPCNGSVFVCGFSAGAQSNWLITQHISRELSSGQLFERLSVAIEYEFKSCDVNQNCKQAFDLYMWETSSIDPSAARITENYVKVGSFTPTSTINGTVQVNGTMDVIFTTEELGVYLALVDEGTCVVIQRVFVFYKGMVCQGNKTDLIEHPEVFAPQEVVVGECTANSYSINGSDPVLRCTDEGKWEVVVPCLCGAGYELRGKDMVCKACHAGTFSVGVSNEPCLPCPENSVQEATQIGLTTECPCIQGYYKTPTEGHSVPCTKPPSAPLNVSISNVTNTSAILSWLPPEDGGGRNISDIFYTISLTGSNQHSTTKLTAVNGTIFVVMGLTPGAYYTFSVTAENAVSSQDMNITDRTVNITVSTLEGVSSRVRDIQEHCTVVVWKQPAETNGPITNYLVTLTRDQQSRSLLTDATHHYYVFQTDDIPPGVGPVMVEVTAKNKLGLGTRSEPVTIGCLTKAPTPSPVSCPQMPACPKCSPSPTFHPPVSCPTYSPLPTLLSCPTCPPCPNAPPLNCPTSFPCPPPVSPSPITCPTCEPCPTCGTPPVIPPDCPNCLPCPSVPTCSPVLNASSCPTTPTCPTIQCPICSPTPQCPPVPSCPPPQVCPTCPTLPSPEPCPTCEGCPAEEVVIPGIVRNVRMSSCNVLSWDLPLDGGKCIFEYRVRVYNGDTYANSSERKVQRTNIRRLTLNWLPVNGTASIVVRAKNNVGFAPSWSYPICLSSDALACAHT